MIKTSLLAISLLALAMTACETEDATTSYIDDVGQVSVYRAWWLATYYPDPVAPGGTSAGRRSVPGAATAYAVLAPGWDPKSSAPPRVLVPVESKSPVVADRGQELHIEVDAVRFRGDCAAGEPLSQDEADFITQRIFPGEFRAMTYDAKTCTLTPASADAGDGG
jgi:hypothetical protein